MQAMTQRPMLHKDQPYLVVGLGLTGYSVTCYLLQHGYQCTLQDDRQQPPYLSRLLQQFPHARVIQGELNESMLADFNCLVVSPGLSTRTDFMRKVIASGKKIIGDIELFAEAVAKPVLAITGSNGKSTVTSLLGEMIAADGKKVAVGGNIGVPALQLLQQDADFYVLELSSFQLETTRSLAPLVATVLNVSEDHMDRYDDLQDYQRSKLAIYHNARYCLSNLDDRLTRSSVSDQTFSLRQPAPYSIIDGAESQLAVDGDPWIACSQLKLKGRHNWANCLAAMAMANLAGISKPAIVKALGSYAGLPHRSQWVARINGVDWINDSKATNPGATRAAIDGIDAPVVLIAGGQTKGADVSSLCNSLRQHVKRVLLFGQDTDQIQAAWQDCVEVQRVADLEQAVLVAAETAQQGDLVLLSPACASFDMYSGFAARGDHFCQLVRALR